MKKVNRLRKRMEQNKKYLIPSLVLLAAMSAGVYGVSKADAQDNEVQTSIVEKIANKFNLNKEDVQKVFDEERSERQKLMQENFEKKLDEAVSSGKLTVEQKNLILAKRVEFQKETEAKRQELRQNSKDPSAMTVEERMAFREERQSEMKKHREEMEAWAKENGIDVRYLMGPMGEGHRGFGRGMMGAEQ